MSRSKQHRKRVKHFDDTGHLHELTFSCYRRLPLLTNDKWRTMLAESIDRATERHQYRVVAFVFILEHVHLLVSPLPRAAGISSLLRAVKRPVSFRIKKLLAQSGSPFFERLTIRQRPGVVTFRFWQEGPGYDRNLTTPKTVLAAIDYIHENPVLRGLCAQAVDWRWSSARFYQSDEPMSDDALPTLHHLPADWRDEGALQMG